MFYIVLLEIGRDIGGDKEFADAVEQTNGVGVKVTVRVAMLRVEGDD